jgi:hypothetical protein
MKDEVDNEAKAGKPWRSEHGEMMDVDIAIERKMMIHGGIQERGVMAA